MNNTTDTTETVTLKTYCETCGERTQHISTEQRDDFGRVVELLTCVICDTQHAVQTV